MRISKRCSPIRRPCSGVPSVSSTRASWIPHRSSRTASVSAMRTARLPCSRRVANRPSRSYSIPEPEPMSLPLSPAARLLAALDLPVGDAHDLPPSPHRFPDGAHYRIEIPSVEGPRVLAAVIEEARIRAVPIHRVSQGSGIMLLTDDEI